MDNTSRSRIDQCIHDVLFVLVHYDLSAQNFPTVGSEGGPTIELPNAFTLIGVEALLPSFGLFSDRVSFALNKLL